MLGCGTPIPFFSWPETAPLGYLLLAYRLLRVLLLVFHLSSADVKLVAAHCPAVNSPRADVACDQSPTARACVLMLFPFH